MSFSRRAFLGAAATTVAMGAFARVASAQSTYANEIVGYGELIPDPLGVFDLPEGFSYRVISQAGETMSDGLVVPHKHDGMGAFALGRDKVILVRNHELKPSDPNLGAAGAGRRLAERLDAAKAYDTDRAGRPLPGGTTTLVYDLRRQRLERQHLSLVGTAVNCAGGATPWGSWLTCEESVLRAGEQSGKSHGWVFEVPSRFRGLVDPVPLTGLGRFKHEAACVDPRTGVVYLTEDEGESLFYRFLPASPGELHKGGRLQALGFRDAPEGADSRNWSEVVWRQGDRKQAVWIDLDGTDNPNNDLAQRGRQAGAVWFARGEGIHWAGDHLYFTCTSGGEKKLGQVVRYTPSAHEGRPEERDAPGVVDLFVEATNPAVMEYCDNLTISPWGHLFVCEDKQVGVNHMKVITPEGKVFTFGRNALPLERPGGSNTELAGVCFSPDGTTLFVNLYLPGMTLAITGPWSRIRS